MTQLAPNRRLILDATLDRASIAGTVTAPSGARREFHGWIELTTAIEALLGSGRRLDAEHSNRSDLNPGGPRQSTGSDT